MAKKKEKADKPAASAEISVPAEAAKTVQADDASENVTAESAETVQDPALLQEEETAYEEEETALSSETLEEIGSPDREEVFQKVARAYQEAKRKREKYKKIGPLFVFISGVVFLTLIFTLDNKITFLIFWIVTILYTVALMIRAEYKYHQFRGYLGLSDEEAEEDGESAEAPQTDGSDEAAPSESKQEEQA